MTKQRRAIIAQATQGLADIKDRLEQLQEEEQAAHDALPEALQSAERGELGQEAADALRDTVDIISQALDALEMISDGGAA